MQLMIWCIFWVATAGAAPLVPLTADKDFFQGDLGQDFIQGDLSQDFSQDSNNQQFFTDSRPQDRILSQNFEQDPAGNYEYSYEQANGQAAEEVGRVQPGPLPETGSLSKQGSYRYIGDNGNTYLLSYLADEGGFQPRAYFLPRGPPQIPEYAQLRREHPELFWAENGGVPLPFINQQQDITALQTADQQFDQESFSDQQFDQQQFDQQSFSDQKFDQQSPGQEFSDYQPDQSFSSQLNLFGSPITPV